MFGSLIADQVIYETLVATPGLTDVVGTRVFGSDVAPQGAPAPVALFYMESSAYDAGGSTVQSEHITSEVMRYRVLIVDASTSNDRIAPAAQAQLDALAGLIVDRDGKQITFRAQGEVPYPTRVEDGTFYQRLGTIYTVTIS